MIFSVEGHVEQIIKGTKTQTRRDSDRYKVGNSYAVQRCRTCKGISEGRILITKKHSEPYLKSRIGGGHDRHVVDKWDAKAEGGYTPTEFEALYRELHPDWTWRYAYEFTFTESTREGGD